MYYHQETNTYIPEEQEFKLNEITYSAKWLSQITAEEIANMGLELVTFEGTNKDSRFYWNSVEHDNAIIRTVNIPKDIVQIKYSLEQTIKREVYEMLQATDYIDIRNLRDPSYKPEWVTWRDSIRTYAADTITAINNALDIPALEVIMSQFSWPKDPVQAQVGVQSPEIPA